jgi:hypothetical protein
MRNILNRYTPVKLVTLDGLLLMYEITFFELTCDMKYLYMFQDLLALVLMLFRTGLELTENCIHCVPML